jgi:hypothetical protein
MGIGVAARAAPVAGIDGFAAIIATMRPGGMGGDDARGTDHG